MARPKTVVLLPGQPRSSSSAQKPTMASPAATSPPIRPAQAPQPARPAPGQNGSATPNAQPQPPTSIPPPPTATPQPMPSNDQPPALSQNNAQAGPGPRTTQKAPPPPPSAEELAKAKRTKETIERKRKEREELLTKKDKSVGEMLVMLEDYQPLIPDEVTDYYLQRSGFECDDPRIKRLLSLAAQKFVNDIASDAFHYAKLRMNAPSTKTGKAGTKGNEKDKSKVVLTMDDLSNALGEHGVNARNPDYYF